MIHTVTTINFDEALMSMNTSIAELKEFLNTPKRATHGKTIFFIPEHMTYHNISSS